MNIRFTSGDLLDIQIGALEEGMPDQTLIASVLHRYVVGKIEERKATAKVRSATVRHGGRRPKSPV